MHKQDKRARIKVYILSLTRRAWTKKKEKKKGGVINRMNKEGNPVERIDEWKNGNEENLCRQGARFQPVGGEGRGRERIGSGRKN